MNQHANSIEPFRLRDDGTYPNHPYWPLLIYPAAIAIPNGADDPASHIESHFRKNGWDGLWRDGVYGYHHYHSNAHEVLGVFRGSARVLFGGPEGVEIELKAGDVAILPAGTAHCNLGSSHDFGVVGGYPPGADPDMCRGKVEERADAMVNISQTPRPKTDPVFGQDGGLHVHWPAGQG